MQYLYYRNSKKKNSEASVINEKYNFSYTFLVCVEDRNFCFFFNN